VEARFGVQLHLAHEPVAVHLVDESRVVAAADRAALPLELAQRRRLPLATLDAALSKAARESGVDLFF
jgi:hypothetical protein